MYYDCEYWPIHACSILSTSIWNQSIMSSVLRKQKCITKIEVLIAKQNKNRKEKYYFLLSLSLFSFSSYSVFLFIFLWKEEIKYFRVWLIELTIDPALFTDQICNKWIYCWLEKRTAPNNNNNNVGTKMNGQKKMKERKKMLSLIHSIFQKNENIKKINTQIHK